MNNNATEANESMLQKYEEELKKTDKVFAENLVVWQHGA